MSDGSDDDAAFEDVLASDKEEDAGVVSKPRKRLMQRDDDDDDEHGGEQTGGGTDSAGRGNKGDKPGVKRLKRDSDDEEKDNKPVLDDGDPDIKADAAELLREIEGGDEDEDGERPTAEDDDGFIVQDGQDREDPDDVIRTEGGWANDSDIEDRDGRDGENDAKMTTFDRKMKEAKLAKKKKKVMDKTEIGTIVVDLIGAMWNARDADLVQLKRGKPALNKIKLLPEIEQKIKKVELRETLLDEHFLRVLKSWLEPLPNDDLPCQPLRTRVLRILDQIPLDTDWSERLDDSEGLPKLVKHYAKKDPHPANARLAQNIMNRWLRSLAETDASMDPEKVLLKQERDRKKRQKQIRDATEMQRAAEEFEKQRYLKKTEKLSENFARPAERLPLGTFANRPASGFVYGSGSAGMAESERVLPTEKLKSLERASKKIKAAGQAGLKRADNVSVQGRDLNK